MQYFNLIFQQRYFTDFSSENISSILYSYNTSEKKKLVSETMNFPVEGSRL